LLRQIEPQRSDDNRVHHIRQRFDGLSLAHGIPRRFNASLELHPFRFDGCQAPIQIAQALQPDIMCFFEGHDAVFLHEGMYILGCGIEFSAQFDGFFAQFGQSVLGNALPSMQGLRFKGGDDGIHDTGCLAGVFALHRDVDQLRVAQWCHAQCCRQLCRGIDCFGKSGIVQ